MNQHCRFDSASEEDLVLVMLSMKKRRRFWIHPLLRCSREGGFHLLIEQLKQHMYF